jgi:hypothetical protein
MGRLAWKRLRKIQDTRKRRSCYFVPMDPALVFLPLAIGDYTDFFTGIHHAAKS